MPNSAGYRRFRIFSSLVRCSYEALPRKARGGAPGNPQDRIVSPLDRSARRWNNGCVPPERPLFPGYVFVHIPPDERVRVLELSGVVSIVGTTREPTPLPDEDIERLRSGLHLVHAEPHPTLTMGETVRIRRGPLQGMTGVVTRQKNSFRVVLTVDLIMKSVAVEVCADSVEPIGKPKPSYCAMAAYAC